MGGWMSTVKQMKSGSGVID